MGRSGHSFRRREPRFKAQPLVLIVCEDKKSSLNYLEDARQHFRANAKIRIVHSGFTDPKGIVEFAVKNAPDYDEIICVIDRDTHVNFGGAMAIAQGSQKIEMCVSYPCFEFWLLIHFKETRKAYMPAGGKSPADLVIVDLREQQGMAEYDKGKVKDLFSKLLGDRFEHACRCSPRILLDAVETGEMNPSTRMHDVMSRMKFLGEVQPA
jgi:hypothetical protein